MSFINAGGPEEALSSLIQSLSIALVTCVGICRFGGHTGIANDVHSFCAIDG